MAAATIRAAAPTDAAAIAAIYAPYVTDTPITFEIDPPDEAEMAARIARIAGRFPYLVAEVEGAVTGYAYADVYRARAAYRWVVETTIYLDRNRIGRGIGRALYAPLLDRLRATGYVAAVGVLALPNTPSIALHEALGFAHVGTQAAVGYKFGAWHDVGVWQLELAARVADPGEPGGS